MIGQLFTQDFLCAGIRETPVWESVTDAELDGFVGKVEIIYAQFKADSNLNEPVADAQESSHCGEGRQVMMLVKKHGSCQRSPFVA